jgi:DNA-binding transcriptional LysR family regulator
MIPLHVKHLETFFWAARLGSFTAAAKRLHSTQSTVSMRISELELRFGVSLFDRSHRKARLTAKGEELMAYTERLLQLTSEIHERIARPDTVAGVVRIGVAEVVAQTWLPRFVEALHRRYPKVSVKFEVALTFELIEKLRSGALDVILSPGRLLESGFTARSLGVVEFSWMTSPRLGLRRGTFTPRDLQDQRIIVLPRESYHYLAIERWFRSSKVFLDRMDVCNSLAVVAALTMAGLGISLLPPVCFAQEMRARQLVTIRTSPPYEPVEFFAIKSAEAFEPLNELVADLAAEVSTFQPARKGGSAEDGIRLPPRGARRASGRAAKHRDS